MNNNPLNDNLFSLDREEINQLGKENVEIRNVLLGYHKKAIQTRGRGMDFELVYIGENAISDDIEGYELQYQFESENHADVILTFCIFISGKFAFENPISLYNVYIDQIRGLFTLQDIEVITQADIDCIKDEYGSGGILMPKQPWIYLRTFTQKQFFRQLFDFDYNSFYVEDDKKYVYLIHSNSNGYFKIGYSKNPLKRERTLQAEEPDISVLKIWEGDGAFEKLLHKKYDHLRVRGEWFRLTFQELWELREL